MNVQEILNHGQKCLLCVPFFVSLHPLSGCRKSFLLQIFSSLPLLHKMALTAWLQARSLPFCPFPSQITTLLFGTLPPGHAAFQFPSQPLSFHRHSPRSKGRGSWKCSSQLANYSCTSYLQSKGKKSPICKPTVVAQPGEFGKTREDCI